MKYLKQTKVLIALSLIALIFTSCYVEEPRGYGPPPHRHHHSHYGYGY